MACDKLLVWLLLLLSYIDVAVDGTVVAVEQEHIADDGCVEADNDQEPNIAVAQPILYIHPKVETLASYDAEQAEAN